MVVLPGSRTHQETENRGKCWYGDSLHRQIRCICLWVSGKKSYSPYSTNLHFPLLLPLSWTSRYPHTQMLYFLQLHLLQLIMADVAVTKCHKPLNKILIKKKNNNNNNNRSHPGNLAKLFSRKRWHAICPQNFTQSCTISMHCKEFSCKQFCRFLECAGKTN